MTRALRRLAAAALLCASFSAPAATWYVRTDGGTSSQCTGRTDAAYPGSGTAQACAYSSPATAVAAVSAGDTVRIANGSYQVSSNIVVPTSGSAAAPIRIRGENAGNCTSKPELWGSGGASSKVIDVNSRSYVEIECIEVTDHSACVYGHPDFPCSGSYARHGIYAKGGTNLTLRDVYVHGVANGFKGGSVTNMTMERVRLIANSEAGFHGATGCSSTESCDAFGGAMIIRNSEIAWNGCGEAYPKLTVIGCHGDYDRNGPNTHGYGDGLGTARTGGQWTVEDSQIHHNTSDGLDLRYTKDAGSSVTIRRSWFYANAGNQVKAWGKLYMENSYLNGWCGYFGTRYGTGVNPQNGVTGTDPEPCRASGNTVIVIPDNCSGVCTTMRYNTIVGHGAALIQSASDNNASGIASYSVLLEGNVVVGGTGYLTGTLPKYISNSAGVSYTYRNNHVYNATSVSCTASQCATTNPLLRGQSITAFDPRPQSGSPVIGAGGCTGCSPPATDINGKARPAAPARGAFEP